MERSPGPINVLLWGWARLLLPWHYSLWVCAISFAGVLKEHLQFCQTEVHSFFRIKGLSLERRLHSLLCAGSLVLLLKLQTGINQTSARGSCHERKTERESGERNERCGREYRTEVIESWLSLQAFLASLKHIRRNTLSHAKILPTSHAGVLHNLLSQSASLSLLGVRPGQCSCQSQLTNTSCNTLSAFKNWCFLLSNCSSPHVVRSFKSVQAINLQGCCE